MSESLKQRSTSRVLGLPLILLKGLILTRPCSCAASAAVLAGFVAALMRTSRFGRARDRDLASEVARNAPDYIMLVWVHFVCRC